MGIRNDYVETQKKWGLPPRRAWRGQTLRKLGGDGGHAVGQRDTRKSASTRTGAHGNIHYHSVHTRLRHTPRSRDEITGRSGRPGLGGLGRAWQSLPTRPCKGLRNRRRLQPAPPSPGRVQWEPGGGKGCVPVPCCAGSRGSGRGEALGAGPRRLLNRPSHGRKQTLPGYPLGAASRLLTHLLPSLHLPRGAAPSALLLAPFRASLLVR